MLDFYKLFSSRRMSDLFLQLEIELNEHICPKKFGSNNLIQIVLKKLNHGLDRIKHAAKFR